MTALRIARREARRAKGRSALVLAMILVPVAGLAFLAIGYDTFSLNPAERAARVMGTAQAAVIWPSSGPVEQWPSDFAYNGRAQGPPADASAEKLLALLPSGSRVIRNQIGLVPVSTVAGIGSLEVRLLDLADPLARGVFHQVSGRAPATNDEVALTPAASRRLGVNAGGTVHLADGARTFRVVGIVEEPDRLSEATIVARSGALDPDNLPGSRWQDVGWLVATPGPVTWDQVKQLNTHGVVVVSRHVLAHPPSDDETYPSFQDDRGDSGAGIIVLVGGLAMLEIILLAGSAFAVSARRRQRDLALVAASGGKPAHLRRIVLADGVVLGALAAIAGIALAIVAFAILHPILERTGNTRSGAFRVFPEALAGLAALAILTGVLAALVPAFAAARLDVVTALAGRRGVVRSRRRWVLVGIVLGLTGAGVAAFGVLRASTNLIVGGLVAAEVGLVICTPALVGLVARLGHWMPLTPRIALRDTSRNRTAAAPAISAVMAAVAGSLAAGVYLLASNEQAANDYRMLGRAGDVTVYDGSGKLFLPGPDQEPTPVDRITAALRNTLPIDAVYEISEVHCQSTTDPCIVAVQIPPERDCPYSPEVLQRMPTTAEQRSARREPRCADGSQQHRYHGGIGSDFGMTYVIDESAVGAVANISAADAEAAAAALRAGSVVVDDPRYLQNDRVTLKTISYPPAAVERVPNGMRLDRAQAQVRTVTAPGFVLPNGAPAPVTLMSKATAQSLGLGHRSPSVLATTTRPPTTAEQDRAQAALSGIGQYFVQVEPGPPVPDTWGIRILAIVAGVITLGAAAIATGLAAADRRPDLGTLAAVGASPRVRRALSLSQSGVIAGLGSVLGALAGVGAAVAVLAARNQQVAHVWPAPTPYPIDLPWFNLGITLLVVPLVAMLGAGLLTRSRLPIERRL